MAKIKTATIAKKDGYIVAVPKNTLMKSMSTSNDTENDVRFFGGEYVASSVEMYANGPEPTETLLNPASTANTLIVTRTGGGAAGLPALADGDILQVEILATNTGATTIAVDGNPPVAIELDGQPLPAGAMVKGDFVNFIYGGVNYKRESEATRAAAKIIPSAVAGGASAPQTVIDDIAVSVAIPLGIKNTELVTTVGNKGQFSLADGDPGDKMVLVLKTLGAGVTAVITPANLRNVTTINLAVGGDSTTLLFLGTEWHVINQHGAGASTAV